MTASPLGYNWRLGDRPDLRSMNVVNGLFRALGLRGPAALPCFDGAAQLLIGSDYGGQHANSHYESLAFVVADTAALDPWLGARERLREKYLPDRRRMSFKSLNDQLRMGALPEFLSAADLISWRSSLQVSRASSKTSCGSRTKTTSPRTSSDTRYL